MKVLIVYYSTYGNVFGMAKLVSEGMGEVEGVEPVLRRVPELMPESLVDSNDAMKAGRDAQKDVPLVTLDDFKEAGAIAFGTPTRFGNVSAQLKNQIDQLSGLWLQGSFEGKPARGQVAGQYFSAMGIPLLHGRDFTTSDTANSPLVVIVNRKFAEHYWPGQDPLGKRIHIGLKETPCPWMTVVGEVGDIKQKSADSDVTEQIYQPTNQFKVGLGQFAPPNMLTGGGGYIVLRSSLGPYLGVTPLKSALFCVFIISHI